MGGKGAGGGSGSGSGLPFASCGLCPLVAWECGPGAGCAMLILQVTSWGSVGPGKWKPLAVPAARGFVVCDSSLGVARAFLARKRRFVPLAGDLNEGLL